jgi:high-affinity iron transporter
MLMSIPWPHRRAARPLFRSAPQSAPAAAPVTCPPTFSARCASCHGASGAGDGPAAAALRPPPRNFTDPSWGAGKTAQDLAALIREGGAKHGLSPAMPAQPDLSDAEIGALVGCVRGLQMKHSP